MIILHAILGLLHYGNMHGYMIKARTENYFGHIRNSNCRQIYLQIFSLGITKIQKI